MMGKRLKTMAGVLAFMSIPFFFPTNTLPNRQGINKNTTFSYSEELSVTDSCIEKLSEEMSMLEELLRRDDPNKADLVKVLYAATANEEIGIGLSVFKDKTKKIDDEANYYLLIDYFDSQRSDENSSYTITGTAYSTSYVEIIKKIKNMPLNETVLGRYDGFSININDKMADNFSYKDYFVWETIFMGVSYKNEKTGEIGDMILAIEIQKNNDEINFECAGTGKKTLQKDMSSY